MRDRVPDQGICPDSYQSNQIIPMSHVFRFPICQQIVLLWLASMSFAIPAVAQVGVRWHVDQRRVSGGDGMAWATAISSLDQALRQALPGDEVWVLRGQYLPTLRQDPQDSRSAAFYLPPGVALRGGFDGSETETIQRGTQFVPTVLSGDLGIPGVSEDNAYHVVLSEGVPLGSQAASVLDGFVIQDGYANQRGHARGAGLRVSTGFLRIQNCTFKRNFGLLSGAIFVTGAMVRIKSCNLIDNATAGRGGALSIQASRCQVANTRFSGNSADRGGAIYAHSIEPFTQGLEPPVSFVNTVIVHNRARAGGGAFLQGSQFNGAGRASFAHCTIAQNLAFERGGGIFARTGTHIPAGSWITNSIIWGNSGPQGSGLAGRHQLRWSNIDDAGWKAGSNISKDPLFMNARAGDFHLRDHSPCIDAGSNTLLEADLTDLDGDGFRFEFLPFDADGFRRLQDDWMVKDTGIGVGPIVDLGAYER